MSAHLGGSASSIKSGMYSEVIMSYDAGWWGKWRGQGLTIQSQCWGDPPERVIAQEEDRSRRIWIVKDGVVQEHDCACPVGFLNTRKRL